MTRVALRNIHLTRGSTPILRGVDLAIEPNEFCVFVGPSGCGKSTLLRLIAGLDEDADGEIEIDGVPVTHLPAARRQVAMVFQGYALYPHMSVYDNMAFALKRAGAPRADIEARVGQAARVLQLDGYLQRKPGALSGGQRQRVAIGRAMVKKPKVFLFDEPLSNLDAALRAETRVEIARLHRESGSASMLYVTHDQTEAMTLADRIVLLRPLAQAAADASSVVQVGRPLDLYHHPSDLFAARFIGSPGMNLLDARVVSAGPRGVVLQAFRQTWTAHVEAADLQPGEPVTLGIRPEHVRTDHGPLHATVSRMEALGEYAVLHLRVPGRDGLLLAKSTREHLRPDDVLAIDLPSEAMHVFRADGRALARRRTAH
ncbi:ABC transporter ATP-binding protein [Pseudorhodoferax sp. Leaf274]|uniref:ABC transporter ATP-binding protein n=1 Tax=Pseudorhodoferax sp. Leaf274 TaxID=1736318 RepID=UPI00070272B8|nr:ATP-binding cassette domain-containing protein [Pseudorhodoferax sp. Leaf274]KQP38923.1 ABC transporter [Pseudorhodoferax sp. Leaf274]